MRRVVDIIAEHGELELRLVEHREQLWLLGIQAAIRRAQAARLCRRSRWEVRRAHRQLQLRLLRNVVKVAPKRRKSPRRRLRARLVSV